MKSICAISLFVFLVLAGSSAVLLADAQTNNPQPQSDDLILPMPGNRIMAFRPVCTNTGSGLYAWQRFRVGDFSGGYKESPTGIAIGGAFRVQDDSGETWCYYIGKYEVSEDQFHAVRQQTSDFNGSSYPVRNISWFEAQDFIRHYNDWLFEYNRETVPAYGGKPGYLRLPTEFEWEFAARGGSRVDSARFDRKIPYPKNKLAEYEWFSGPESSHNKVKKIGILKANPLGLHDMLGNVAEMTRSLYRVEYYQGRSGGFVARGGHCFTNKKQIRSSMRSEQEFYAYNSKKKKIVPAKKKTLGFRLVISSLVFPNRQISHQMKKDWEAYRQGIAQTLPAAVSTSSTSAKTQVSGTDAGIYLDRLKKELITSGVVTEDIQQELDHLASSLNEIQFAVNQAEKDSAYAWIKIAAEQAFFIVKDSKKLPILHKLQKTAKLDQRTNILKKYNLREKEILQNIDQAMSSYTESIRQLGSTGGNAIQDGVERYQSFLKAQKAKQQLLLLPTVQLHTAAYLKQKRTDDEKWQKELMQWHARSTGDP